MAFLIPQSTLTTLQAGPFVSTVDGVTVLPSLTILPSDRRLSLNGGPFMPSTSSSTATYLNEGFYAFPLSVADTQLVGTLRIVITAPTALAVWLDVVIVPQVVYTVLAGVSATPLLLQGTQTLLTLGPFIASANGVTIQTGLTIAPTEIQLSRNDGTFSTGTATTLVVDRGYGHYSPTLTADDTADLGDLRVSITLPGSLPVWLDYTVVDQTTWNFYFAIPPVPAVLPTPPPVPTQPAPLGVRTASSLYPGISALLDDPQQLRAEEEVLLRFLTRAQQWVALRYRLLLHTFPLEVIASVPWYALPPLLPRVVMVTEVVDPDGKMLLPVPLTRLRYSDPQWLASSGTPTRFYRVGWTTLGLYKVPDAYGQYTLTGVLLPRRLEEGGQPMETPVSYDDAVMQVAAGLLLLGRERNLVKGMALLSQGLGMPQTSATAAAD